MDLAKQYNNVADDFSKNQNLEEEGNRFSRKAFYSQIDFIKPKMKVLDLACGDGIDLLHYKELGADVCGLDASSELIKIARKNLPDAQLNVSLFETIPFEENYFDVVLSKYAIMTSADMNPVFEEIHRVLKPGGTMMYLVTHPFRQFFEKQDSQANYFEQKIVDCHILGNTVTIKEPTHTMNEFLNDFLFKNFDVQSYEEYHDPAAESIDGKKYPGFFIIKAKKR
ncbi:MAG: class I SAM-dependent methyltransferase [Candidatus Moraniibacteriota bacterium]